MNVQCTLLRTHDITLALQQVDLLITSQCISYMNFSKAAAAPAQIGFSRSIQISANHLVKPFLLLSLEFFLLLSLMFRNLIPQENVGFVSKMFQCLYCFTFPLLVVTLYVPSFCKSSDPKLTVKIFLVNLQIPQGATNRGFCLIFFSIKGKRRTKWKHHQIRAAKQKFFPGMKKRGLIRLRQLLNVLYSIIRLLGSGTQYVHKILSSRCLNYNQVRRNRNED